MAVAAPQPTTAYAPQKSTVFRMTPTSVTGGTSSAQTVTITGLDPLTHLVCHVPTLAYDLSTPPVVAQTAGIVIDAAYVSAKDTLTVVFTNTGSTGTPVDGTYQLIVE